MWWMLAFEYVVNMVRYIPVLRGLVSLAFALGAFLLATVCCTTCTLIARITVRPVQSIMIISGLWVSILFVLPLSDGKDKQLLGEIDLVSHDQGRIPKLESIEPIVFTSF